MKKFLTLHFVSSFGDGLLYYGLPIGVGVSTKDVRSTILMFLIPAIAIKISTYFSSFISMRVKKAKKDYAFLLIFLGIIELVFSLLIYFFQGNLTTVVLSSAFCFLYAFLKEGIPRILFSVNMYSYFVDQSRYKEIISYGHIVRILATFLGAILAGTLIYKKNWELSLVIDSFTFVLYGLGLVFWGQESEKIVNSSFAETVSKKELQDTNGQRGKEVNFLFGLIAVIIPLMSFFSCLYYPYLNILIENYDITMAYKGVLLTGTIGGILAVINYSFPWFSKVIGYRPVIIGIPSLFILGSVLFNAVPSFWGFIVCTVSYSLYGTVFNTADFSLRIRLPVHEMIRFNTLIMNRFSKAQLLSTSMAMIFYSFNFSSFYISILIFVLSTVTITFYCLKEGSRL